MENLSYGQHLAYFFYSDILLSWNCLIPPCLSYIDLLHPTIQSLYNYTNNSTVNPLGFWIFEPQKSIVLTHIYWKISSFLYNICYLHTIFLYLYVQGGGINLLAIRRVLQNQAFSSPFRKLWTSWQSLMLWTYRQGSCLLESWAFQRLATRIKAQESVVQSINLIGYFVLWIFWNSYKNDWNSKMKPMYVYSFFFLKPMYVYSNFSNISNYLLHPTRLFSCESETLYYFIYIYILINF